MITQEIIDQVAEKELEIKELLKGAGIDFCIVVQAGHEPGDFKWPNNNELYKFVDYDSFHKMLYSAVIDFSTYYDGSQVFIINHLIKTLSERLMEIETETCKDAITEGLAQQVAAYDDGPGELAPSPSEPTAVIIWPSDGEWPVLPKGYVLLESEERFPVFGEIYLHMGRAHVADSNNQRLKRFIIGKEAK